MPPSAEVDCTPLVPRARNMTGPTPEVHADNQTLHGNGVSPLRTPRFQHGQTKGLRRPRSMGFVLSRLDHRKIVVLVRLSTITRRRMHLAGLVGTPAPAGFRAIPLAAVVQ